MRNKGAWLFWTNLLNGLLGLGLLATGFILRWVLPPGSGGGGHRRGVGRGRWAAANDSISSLLGMTRHEWGDIHFWIAVAFVAGILFHLAMHLGYIRTTTPRYLLAPFHRHRTA